MTTAPARRCSVVNRSGGKSDRAGGVQLWASVAVAPSTCHSNWRPE